MFEPDKHALLCQQCQKYMRLMPVSRDLEATHWECKCKWITLKAIRECFDNCSNTFNELYRLNKFTYDIANRNFEIVSNEWIGESRINSRRKLISPTERDEILSDLKQAVEDSISVSFESWSEAVVAVVAVVVLS
jgi:hypothetical protein